MVSYLCGLKFFKIKLGLFDCLFTLTLITLLFSNFIFYEPELVLTRFRFYFGFFVFYIFFKSGEGFPFRRFLLLLLIIIPIEAFLINTFISPYDMPNFPNEEATSHFNLGGYQRPYSFGGNSSVSSSLLVILLSLVTMSTFRNYLAVICVFIFSSGTGFIVLLVSILLKRIKIIIIGSFSILLLVVLFHSDIISFIDGLGLKLNSDYILVIIDFKINQINVFFDGFSTFDYLFGNLDSLEEGYGGDFGWMYFVSGYGIISFMILNLFILSKVTKGTFIPILLSILATFHYPVIFFLPGQIILGYLMAQKYLTIKQ